MAVKQIDGPMRAIDLMELFRELVEEEPNTRVAITVDGKCKWGTTAATALVKVNDKQVMIIEIGDETLEKKISAQEGKSVH